jgi:hypothetical protein
MLVAISMRSRAGQRFSRKSAAKEKDRRSSTLQPRKVTER